MRVFILEERKGFENVETTIEVYDSEGSRENVPFYRSKFAEKYGLSRWDNIPKELNPISFGGNTLGIDLYKSSLKLNLSFRDYLFRLKEASIEKTYTSTTGFEID